MRRYISIPGILLLSWGLLQQSSDPALTYHDHLGFSLFPGANSTPVTFHIIRTYDDPARQITATNISESEFIAIGLGLNENHANPDNVNFFDKYEIYNCGYTNDTIIYYRKVKGGMFCNPVSDLWRLEYQVYPFYSVPPKELTKPGETTVTPGNHGPGWAKFPLHPSPGQEAILQNYGVKFYDDPIYGDNAFRLLHDIQDDGWVSRYKSS
jgi:hypothetical protein